MLLPRILFFSLLCAVWTLLPAQQRKFRRLTVDDGLPFNTVGTLCQDSIGFIWMGTPGGLARYDGYSLKVFKHQPDDSTSLIYDGVRALIAGKNGEVWIGTRNGVSVYRPQTGSFLNFYPDTSDLASLNEGHISALLEVNGKIWIGTLGGGINVLDTVSKSMIKIREPGIPSGYIRGMSRDKKGNIWISFLAHGVACVDPNGKLLLHLTTREGLRSNDTRNVFCDSRGMVWISCWNAGTNMYDPASKRMWATNDTSELMRKLEHGLISSFMEDREGRIWMATAEHGPGMYDPKKGTVQYFESDPEDPSSMSDKTTFSVLEDRSGVIWIGTWHGGVNCYDPKAHVIEHYKSSKLESGAISSNVVWRFLERFDGKLLIGTSRSLNEFDPVSKKSRVILTDKAGTPDVITENSIIQGIYETAEGDLWLSANGSGIYHWNAKTKKFFNYIPAPHPGSFPFHTCYNITRDKEGQLWFGTTGSGIAKYVPEKGFEVYAPDPADSNSLISEAVFYMLVRDDGRFWVCTADGLDLFNPITGTAIHYRHHPKDPRSIAGRMVNTVLYGKDGRLWIGTGSGLCSLDEKDGIITRYTEDPGSPGDADIMGLAEDDQGRLWIPTNKGLFLMNLADQTFRLLEPADGVQSRQFMLNSIYKDSKGLIYVGGVNGFNIINPEKVTPNRVPPPVVFTRFTVLNEESPLSKKINTLKEIEVSYYDDFFSLEFSALEFSDPSRNRFKYFLEGFSEDWVELGNTRFVTFTNLSPGTYTLKVKACNNHGIWNEQSTDLVIIIPPPFYMTWWFYTLCTLAVISGIWYYIRWRERKLQDEKTYLESVVSVRTRELREEKEKVDAAHKDIKDSINYAKRIQEAMLPLAVELKRSLPESFILFMPRDVVSGDFYWFLEKEDHIYIAAADCTGHGVPGALMSMIGASLLSQIVNEGKAKDPGGILHALDHELRLALKQHLADSDTRDGMDIALVRLHTKTNNLEYAGANRPLYLIRKEIPEIEEVRASKFPIGGAGIEDKSFGTHKVKLEPGDTFYIFSDGYPDQFGGGTGKKFMTKNFKRLLMLYNGKEMDLVRKQLEDEFEQWRGEFEQVDDVLVIGVRIRNKK